MGFSSSWNRYIQGFSTDMMKAPKANLFISVLDENSLTNHPSMFKNWDGKNIIDLITILQSDPELTRLCSDTYPDSFKFILNKNNNWQSDIESIVSSFKNLYK